MENPWELYWSDAYKASNSKPLLHTMSDFQKKWLLLDTYRCKLYQTGFGDDFAFPKMDDLSPSAVVRVFTNHSKESVVEQFPLY